MLTYFFYMAHIPMANCNSSRASVARKETIPVKREYSIKWERDVKPEISNAT
jgi:hypothetical protein